MARLARSAARVKNRSMDGTNADEGAPAELIGNDRERLERSLIANHGRFRAFLSRRLGSDHDADEVLQSAYVRAIEKGVPDDTEEGIVAWFYRVLRNAVIDATRRREAEQRGVERLTREQLDATEDELRGAVCACVHDVLPALKPEYARVVREVDLEQRPVADVASDQAITVNNATVRLHRARRALKHQLLRTCGACATHGCLECHCRTARVAGPRPTRS